MKDMYIIHIELFSTKFIRDMQFGFLLLQEYVYLPPIRKTY